MVNLYTVVFITDKYGNTPLHEAIKNGHDLVVSLLVESGALLYISDAGNCLCLAVAREDLDYLRRVMDNGADPNSKNYDLRTPLHIASSKGLLSIAHLLLEAGASVFPKDRYSLDSYIPIILSKNDVGFTLYNIYSF